MMKTSLKPEIIWTEIDSIQVRVLKYGQGEPILFLHGWGCQAETMAGIANTLADSYCCYLTDFPGFGETAPPPIAWKIDDYTRFTGKLIQVLNIEGCGVLAHSFGGRIMLKLLSNPNYSYMVNKVLITGGAGMKPKRKPGYYFRKYTAKLLKAPFSLLPGSMQEKGLQWLRKTPLWKKLGSSDYSQLNGVMREVFVNTVTEFLENSLPDIEHEVFLLWGEKDVATPLYQAKRMEAGLKNATLVTIADAGHYAFFDQPHRFSTIARAYFSG